jgi:RNA-directed DNA polymerase
MKMGRCEITGIFLCTSDVHCHHYIPIHLGGNDKFNNLRILHKDIHKLIHQTDTQTIAKRINKIVISKPIIQKINKYRKKCGMESIS